MTRFIFDVKLKSIWHSVSYDKLYWHTIDSVRIGGGRVIAKSIFVDNLSLFSVLDHYFGFSIYAFIHQLFYKVSISKYSLPFISIARQYFVAVVDAALAQRNIYIPILLNFWNIFLILIIETCIFDGIQLGI